jgi:hypothetical protein
VSTSSLCTLRNMTWMHWRRRQAKEQGRSMRSSSRQGKGEQEL